MRRFKLGFLISLACLVTIVFYGLLGYSQSSSPTVTLRMEPQETFPFEAEAQKHPEPVNLTLQAVDSLGTPLKAVSMRLSIDNPPKNPWLSTDFPMVEGTQLLQLETFAPKGELRIKQMFSIRGTYSLNVQVTPTKGSKIAAFEKKLSIDIGENPIKYRNYAILVVILLGVGLIGGLIIGKQSRITSNEGIPESVRMLLSGLIVVAIGVLLFVNVKAEKAEAHGHGHSNHSTSGPTQTAQPPKNVKVELLGNQKAIVGQPASFKIQAFNQNQPLSALNFKLTSKQEEGWTAFAYQGVLNEEGEFAWKQGFFDGAPHIIQVELSPQKDAKQQFTPFSLNQQIEVEGVAPPLTTRLISLGYMTAFISLGFLLGLRLISWFHVVFDAIAKRV